MSSTSDAPSEHENPGSKSVNADFLEEDTPSMRYVFVFCVQRSLYTQERVVVGEQRGLGKRRRQARDEARRFDPSLIIAHGQTERNKKERGF